MAYIKIKKKAKKKLKAKIKKKRYKNDKDYSQIPTSSLGGGTENTVGAN